MRIKNIKTRGIYYLYKNNKVVYIGQSNFCEKRIFQHIKKDFDEYEIIENKSEDLNEIEALEILNNKPIYNKTIPKNKKFIKLKSFLEEKKKGKIYSCKKRNIDLKKKLYYVDFKENTYFKKEDLININ
jgi:hypothetical protein